MKLYIIFTLSAFAFLSACTKGQWDVEVPSTTNCSTTTDTIVLAGKDFVLNKLELESNGYTFVGTRLQAGKITQTSTNTFEFDFLSGIMNPTIDLSIKQGTYDKMNLEILIDNLNDNSLELAGTYYLSTGSTYDVDMKFDVPDDIFIDMLNGQEFVSFSSDESINLNIQINPEVLFQDVNPGLWNAASVTSINGSNTIVVDQLNNQSIYSSIHTNISESISVIM